MFIIILRLSKIKINPIMSIKISSKELKYPPTIIITNQLANSIRMINIKNILTIYM